MDSQSRSALLVNRPSLVRDLRVDYVFPYLLADGILTDQDVQIIKHEVTSVQQAGRLLDIIATKGPGAYFSFTNALQESEYDHLVQMLDIHARGDYTATTRELQAILVDGGVPPRPQVYTERPELVCQIREALKTMSETGGWVVVHGMGGSGKSVLAAEAVRHVGIASLYPGGIFFLNIGAIDHQQLLTKMQNLISLLENEPTNPARNSEEAKNRLRLLFAHQHARALLILDDVWNQYVTKAFDVQSHVLVTTRNSDVADTCTGTVRKVPITQGFTLSQSLEMFSKWTGLSREQLPPEAEWITEECKGSPLAISMIGALMQAHPNRWPYYYTLLKKRKTSRLRKSSSYEYESLSEAVSISVTNLDEQLRNYYYYFSIFMDDVRIPTRVFAVLWDEEVELVEDTMDRLVNKSLVIKEWNKPMNTFFYSIHDLQLDYLKEHCLQLQAFHRQLVERYKHRCSGQWFQLAADGYIHWFLAYHMYRADMLDEMCKAFLDLRFVETMLRISGPSNLIGDYVKYSAAFIGEHEGHRQDFLHFVSSNAHKFNDDDSDVIQLALCFPQSSKVYRDAKTIATERSRKIMYFNWCNQNNLNIPSYLSTKLHKGPVYCAEFSSDNKKVLSCSADGMIKIMDKIAGQELLSIDAHDEQVNKCHFSHDSTMIISCSNDRTLKLWKVLDHLQPSRDTTPPIAATPSPKMRKSSFSPVFSGVLLSKDEIVDSLLRHEFKLEADILVCEFSADDQLLVAGTADGVIVVWQTTNLQILHQFSGHELPVCACSFSSRNQFIASSSYDRSLLVWDLETGDQAHKSTGYQNIIKSLQFKPMTNLLIFCCENVVYECDMDNDGACEILFKMAPDLEITCLAVADNGDHLALGVSNHTIMVMEMLMLEPIGTLRTHTGWIHHLAFSPTNQELVSASDDETVTVWDLSTISQDDTVALKRDISVKYKDNCLLIAAPDVNFCLKIFRGLTGELFSQTTPETCRIRCCDVSNDWLNFVYGCDDGRVKIGAITKTVMAASLELGRHLAIVRCVRFSLDGHWQVTCSDDKTIKVWSDGRLYTTFEGHTEPVTQCWLLSDNTKICSSSYDGTVKVWDMETKSILVTCAGHDEWILAAAISMDQTKILTASVDKTLKVLDMSTGALMCTLIGHRDCVRSCSFSANGRLVASGDDEGYIRLWRNERKLKILVKHEGWVRDVKFSPDSRLLVSVSDTIKWWQVDGGLQQTFHVRGRFLKNVFPSADFTTFVTVDSAGILYILKTVENSL